MQDGVPCLVLKQVRTRATPRSQPVLPGLYHQVELYTKFVDRLIHCLAWESHHDYITIHQCVDCRADCYLSTQFSPQCLCPFTVRIGDSKGYLVSGCCPFSSKRPTNVACSKNSNT